jgi:hypothetical protein
MALQAHRNHQSQEEKCNLTLTQGSLESISPDSKRMKGLNGLSLGQNR